MHTIQFSRPKHLSLGTALCTAMLVSACSSGSGGSNDNDDTITANLNLSVNNSPTTEGNIDQRNKINFTLSLSKALTVNVTVEISTESGTATSGTDFTPFSEQVSIAAGQTTTQFSVEIIGDDEKEGDESFNTLLSNANSNAGKIGIITNTVTAIIKDDDVKDKLDKSNIGFLNDTGVLFCGDANTNTQACSSDAVSNFPGQDGQFGRDTESDLKKLGAGAAGFDFTKLDTNGADLDASATEWACVRDNHTGLIWEAKQLNGLHDNSHKYTWYYDDISIHGDTAGTPNGGSCNGLHDCDTSGFTTAVNNEQLCGINEWQVPDREQLRSIIDYSAMNQELAIDTTYFPNTIKYSYWTITTYSVHDMDLHPDAFAIDLYLGDDSAQSKELPLPVRLVFPGPRQD